MTRRAMLWWSVAALAVMVLGVTWFMAEFEEVPTTRWEQMGPEARKNRYLALERFSARMGRRVQAVPDARRLAALPRGGVLILDRERRRHLPPERADALLRWVASGGYLIVAAERNGTEDPLLRRLGVSWYVPPHKEADDEEPAPPGKQAEKAAKPPATVTVQVPGVVRPLAIERIPVGLLAGKPAPLWQAELEPGQAQMLHYAWGQGGITVFNDLRPFVNWNLSKYDHAEILWSLLSAYQPQGTMWIAARLKVATLWEWLAGSAWMALVSGAVLVLLWLWHIVPRFGGLRQLPAHERRELTEHLTAVGRAVWREGGLAHWLTLARQALLARIARRHPHLLQIPADECAAALARLSGMTTSRVRQALEGRGTASPHAFTDTVRAIQQLEQRL